MTRVVFNYKPNPATAAKLTPLIDGRHPQHAFHRDRLKVRYRACLAGTGGGKTYAALAEDLYWMIAYPGSVGIIAEPDYNMITRIVIPKLCDLLGVTRLTDSPLIKSYHKTDHRLEAWNGSVAWLLGLEDPEKAEGPDVDWFHVDEARMVRHWEAAFKTLRRRLRGTGKGYPRGGWITTHSPTKAQVDFFEGPVDKRHPSAKVYRWTSFDNGFAPDDYLDDIKRAHEGAAYKAAVLGLYARPEGLVYSNFDPAKHVRELPPELTVDHMSYGIDWGFSLPCSVSAWAWTGSTVWGVDEFYGSNYDVEDIIEALERMQSEWGPGKVHCGHDKPEHIRKLRNCDAGFDAEAYVGKVADGTQFINGMYRGDDLFISPRMRHLRYELDLYSLKPETDEPEKGNDHACDGKRYGIMGELSNTPLAFSNLVF